VGLEVEGTVAEAAMTTRTEEEGGDTRIEVGVAGTRLGEDEEDTAPVDMMMTMEGTAVGAEEGMAVGIEAGVQRGEVTAEERGLEEAGMMIGRMIEEAMMGGEGGMIVEEVQGGEGMAIGMGTEEGDHRGVMKRIDTEVSLSSLSFSPSQS
jgi:hypothetical protein